MSGLTISDTLTDGDGNSLNLNQQPYFVSSSLGSGPGAIKVGEVALDLASVFIPMAVAVDMSAEYLEKVEELEQY